MNYSVKSVHKALRICGLKHKGTGRGNRKECWSGDDGKSVELVVRGNRVPPAFFGITAAQIESKGICSREEFKNLVRSANN